MLFWSEFLLLGRILASYSPFPLKLADAGPHFNLFASCLSLKWCANYVVISVQVSLQSMLSGSAAGSFADDIMKWQKRLQTIEAVLTVWLEVQGKWIELEDVSFFFYH